MLETAMLMLTAHLLGDFVFQPDRLIAAKRTATGMAIHGLILGALTALCLTPMNPIAWCAVAIIVATHVARDLIKIHWLGDHLWSFVADQLFHMAVIAALAIAWPDLASQSLLSQLTGDVQAHVYAGLAILCGFILGVPAGGVLIKKLSIFSRRRPHLLIRLLLLHHHHQGAPLQGCATPAATSVGSSERCPSSSC